MLSSSFDKHDKSHVVIIGVVQARSRYEAHDDIRVVKSLSLEVVGEL